MSEQQRRRDLVAEYQRTGTEAGVYRIVNTGNDKVLLGSSANLAGTRNRIEFARSSGTPDALDRRLRDDIEQFGLDAFSVEVLDVLDTTPEMTDDEIKADLATLQELWRERIDPDLLY